MKLFSYRDRPAHLGPYPLERLARRDVGAQGDLGPRRERPAGSTIGTGGLARAFTDYRRLFAQFRDGEVAPERAPVADDPQALVDELKAAAYFMDAIAVGACALPDAAWYATGDDGAALTPYHANALVLLIAHGRAPERDNPATAWVAGTQGARAVLRGAEIAAVLAGYVRRLGWPARVHVDGAGDVDLERAAVLAGLAEDTGGVLAAPFVGAGFGIAVVSTDMPLAADRPLATGAARGARDWRYQLGVGGTRSGLEERREARRASHLSRYPMERIRRVAEPTTLILEDEVPRVPKRAAFFERALKGDLGAKSQRERLRFATKHPFSHAMTPLIMGLVPHQDGDVAAPAPGTDDPAANARAVKSLSYYLDADLVGVCEAKPYTWYSHGEDGTPIEPKHKYAIVMLIDQGQETMEGASGDDWISGAQSMRGYLRGAEIAGLVAAQIRSLGYPARAQTNRDSDVLQIPLILLAGLGELSRIGELVLNPFVGPRFKSVVVTTDMPLAVDPPIDFGLQDMCSKCFKCARECPCDAISYGDKVMFNGYAMWKPDVERCTRYRVTNPHGSACGRCMKMCPYTNEGLLTQRLFLWCAIRLPWTRKWIADLDDRLRNGAINPVKKWWSDLEWLPDGTAKPPRGANTRGLDLEKDVERFKAKANIAYYHADAMPPPDAPTPVPVDRKAALKAAEVVETPAAARARHGRGEAAPAHYRATPPVGAAADD